MIRCTRDLTKETLVEIKVWGGLGWRRLGKPSDYDGGVTFVKERGKVGKLGSRHLRIQQFQ